MKTINLNVINTFNYNSLNAKSAVLIVEENKRKYEDFLFDIKKVNLNVIGGAFNIVLNVLDNNFNSEKNFIEAKTNYVNLNVICLQNQMNINSVDTFLTCNNVLEINAPESTALSISLSSSVTSSANTSRLMYWS